MSTTEMEQHYVLQLQRISMVSTLTVLILACGGCVLTITTILCKDYGLTCDLYRGNTVFGAYGSSTTPGAVNSRFVQVTLPALKLFDL